MQLDIENLFLGKALEDINNEGDIELNKCHKVKAKNLLGDTIEKDQKVVAVKCRKTGAYYIYSCGCN